MADDRGDRMADGTTAGTAPGAGLPLPGWAGPEDALARAVEVLRAPRPAIMRRLSEVLADLVPHTAIAQLSGVCTHSPTGSYGRADATGRITSLELGRLAESVRPGRPWQGEAVLAGSTRPAVAVSAAPAGTNGALLVLVRAADGPLPESALAVLQQLWELVTAHTHHRATDAAPQHAVASRASAMARARAIAELTGTHASALSAILATLRSAALDDAAARNSATELAVSSLLELRAGADLDRELSEEPVDTAFARLADELRPLLRHGPVRLDLLPPAAAGTTATVAATATTTTVTRTGSGTPRIPADIAHTARAAVRSTVLAMLEQDNLSRLHVSWQLVADTLRAVVRDDGPGLLAVEALAVHRTADRVTALEGRLTVDAVPGWGTTVTVDLPLNAPGVPVSADPLDGLQPRELEVLDQLAQGRRNREIALALHISESTVKFHVANILAKLGVASRGEAAALAHRAGLPTAATLYAAS
ncbi:LuxR C-terminal-related transcriptional regulator [Kitasatospora sp. NPDC048239]|uniref:LuxR C-terminal-related transcriptional regulator n=1 Tax=Kitasatospora sp. NPDC048239 TaxID=3364046 RepID=UPI00371CCE2F